MLKISLRIGTGIALIILAFIIPWWVTCVALLVLAYTFPFFFEFLLVGGILWLLYYPASPFNTYVPLVLLAVMFVGIEYSKKYLIFYSNE